MEKNGDAYEEGQEPEWVVALYTEYNFAGLLGIEAPCISGPVST
jgi:hypothetical protein